MSLAEVPLTPTVLGRTNKSGHFAAKCRTRNNRKRPNTDDAHVKPKTEKIRCIREDDDDDATSSSNFIFNIGDGDDLIWCKIGGILTEMLIDSGSAHNIIDEHSWEYLKKSGIKVRNMNKTVHRELRAYAQTKPLEIIGSFEADILIADVDKDLVAQAKFYVIRGGTQPLLGKITAKLLGVLVLGLPSTRQNQVNQLEDNPSACQTPPIALLSKVEEKLDELLKADIIDPVRGHSDWVSPIVVIAKDNGDIRLCVDMRQVNKAVKRENHLMPMFEDFLPRLRSAKIFSRLDVKNAFHQIELDPSCRHITTFITHKGMYRYKRLMFGISCAPEIFQKTMEQILSKCVNALNYIDDIVVFGATIEEHDDALRGVIKAFKEYDVLLNQGKCHFRVKQLEFLGHMISEKGIRPTESKIEAVQKFRAPQSKEEVRSFLGLVTYVSRFLPDCATITFPLRELCCSKEVFKWEKNHEEAFKTLKAMIADSQTLSYFNNNRVTQVVADASPVALGAVLVQFEGEDREHPYVISYASKSLSETERRYCQTEKEALALVWAVERFSVYPIGRVFELVTDHKPLEVIFKPSAKPCARIERWLLRLQSFTYKVVYKKGSLNVADSLSRLPEVEVAKDFDKDSEIFVRAVMESAAVDVSEIEECSKNDKELKIVRECLESGNWNRPEVKKYQPFVMELGQVGDIVVRGNKFVVPFDLRQRMLELAHEGHPGETTMKRRLRDRVWWPGMDSEAVKVVQSCEGCRLVAGPSKPEPMLRKTLPEGPWIDIAIDFMGPLPSGEYLLVIVDYYSRYKEVEVMTKISARDTINRLDKIFIRLGYPRTITLDNAKQFVSGELDEYSKQKGIVLNHTIPYWPQQNGEVERQNRSLLKRIKISHALNRDWKQDLKDYLLMYYTTPHSTTGKTPTELCYGRTIRGKIPALGDIATAPPSSEFRDRDRRLKEKGKEREDERRGAKSSSVIEKGDSVLLKNLPGNKLETNFGRTEYEVIEKSGPAVTVVDKDSGKIYERNSAHVRKVLKLESIHQDGDNAEETVRRSLRQRKVPRKLEGFNT
ncbi:uncharacterized protein K02A2.6-like [Phlebotomus papatasi]|uniref:uncharacterized protein K02A2.6-like n=1 Tax=Phlebotomus papatasi TaxID=29031 RepID=UPI0024841EB4|nr:uncharacterized protein K02A2.6-like [Phlebotomus papatasi]